MRVNIVSPGPIQTGMFDRFTGTDEMKAGFRSNVPLKRIGDPDEVAAAIVFVSSDKATFMTGATIAVDGGLLAK